MRDIGKVEDLLDRYPQTFHAVIAHLLPFIGYPRILNALRVLNEVTAP